MPITKTITHGQLEPGMRVWNKGYLFEVSHILSYQDHKGREVIRYTGRCVDPTCGIANTGYNGATYGAFADVPCDIEDTDLLNRCRNVIEDARKVLGPDLGGFSPLDLLADNVRDRMISTLRRVLIELGYDQYRQEG